MKKHILLFYKYVDIDNLKAIKDWQLDLCTQLKLTGRIILAHEGINATVCGAPDATDAYINAMNEHELFGGIDFKCDVVSGKYDYFPKLSVKIKQEIVNLGIDPTKVSAKETSQHLTPQQAHQLIEENDKDLVILDARNNYESAIGTFSGAITPDIKTFREFPEYIDQNQSEFKDKKVLMFCTGGIRCERATAYLSKQKLAKEVYQIEGGIVRYAQHYPDGFFRGKNYVFDARVSVPITDDILGSCSLCSQPCDEYINCRNASCNNHVIACQQCQNTYNKTCSNVCKELLEQKKVAPRPERKTVKAVV
ncbi:MAG: rhodanese-related sulfurtransferase [Epsilonproteobacteria bacterium]|nr:rhodanese-related sulfurtransferase [Campylobacterota bacterium]